MALYTVSSGNTINAADINQMVNILQQQSGGQEVGKYHLMFNSYTNGAQGQCWIPTLSRNSAPVSVTIDTTDQAPQNCGAPNTNLLKSSGFQIYAASNGQWLTCNTGGNFTVQY